jgi:hypothetical protein
MVNNTDNKGTSPKCFQCGSELIFVSQETLRLEGTRYPQTNTIYRCSNEECQKKKDKEKIDRQKQKENRESIEKERMEKIQEKRKLGRKVKVKEN